jgi:glycosyltransferase involved in cell wall biosynthesis
MIIAFASLFGRQYEGGANWLEVTLLSLGTLPQPPTCLVVGATEDALPPSLSDSPHVCAVPLSHAAQSRGRRLINRVARRLRRRTWESPAIARVAAEHGVDLWVAFAWFEGLGSHRPLVIAYPDFQFRHLPEYFEPGEIRQREDQWAHVAEHAEGVVTISAATAADALASHPQIKDKLYVCGFPPVFRDEDLRLDADAVRRKYQLPERFFLVSNQFWEHKNHLLVLRALAELKQRGEAVPVVVFTGRPYDPRRPDFFTRLLMFVNEQGLHEHCRFLGVLPRAEQIALIRAAAAVVQPSRFEGRGAITEEACLLGTQLLCSDLPAHRELDLPGAIFFDTEGVSEVADLLGRDYPRARKTAREIADESARRARDYGGRMMRVCEEVVLRRRRRIANANAAAAAGGAA